MTDPIILATPQDVGTLWRPLTSDEVAQASLYIRMASAALRQRCPWIDTRLTDGSLDPDLVRMVVVRVVLRVMRNPDLVASKITGPYAVTYAGADATSGAGQLRVTDEDVEQLTGGVPNRRGSVGTIRLGTWSSGDAR